MIQDRKAEHLDICENEDVEFERTTLLEEVELVHQALPDLDLEGIDLGVEVMGRKLAFPLIITAMTGGTEEGLAINRSLARLAEEFGLGLGLGSQRPMVEDASLISTYRVRAEAPTALLLGNIGVMQASRMEDEHIVSLVESIGADGLCLHLNVAQEIVQQEGDRSFRGTKETIARVERLLPGRVMVKETGCGITRSTALLIREAGVKWIDIAGGGGTSWVEVERLRILRRGQGASALGMLLSEWGVPTAACLLSAQDLDMELVASGGVRTALDMAKALALGAKACGMALPLLRALSRGGEREAQALLAELRHGLKALLLLTGCSQIERLRQRRPFLLRGALAQWFPGQVSSF